MTKKLTKIDALSEAKKLFDEGHIPKSEKILRKILEKDPDFIDAKIFFSNFDNVLMEKARIFFENRNYKFALIFSEHALKKHPKDVLLIKIFSLSLVRLKKFKESIKFLEEVLKENDIQDNEILNNLGNLYAQESQYQKSIDTLRKSLELNYNPMVQFNLGLSLTKLSFWDGIEEIQQAIKYSPDSLPFYEKLVDLLIEKKEFDESLKWIKEGLSHEFLNKNLRLSYIAVATKCLKPNKAGNYEEFDKKLLSELVVENIKSFRIANDIVFSLLPSSLKKFINNKKVNFNEKIYGQNEVLDFLNYDLVINLIKHSCINNYDLERVFRKIRYDFLRIISNGYSKHFDINNYNQFLLSLAYQSFSNEYVWNVDEEEEILLEKLIETFDEERIDKKNALLIIASYRNLYGLSLKNINKIKDKDVHAIIKFNIDDRDEEERIKENIESFGKISNKVSKEIQTQYEKYPHPNWTKLQASRELTPEYLMNLETVPNKINYKNESPSILFVGCGTGQDLITIARILKKAKFTAIDISKTSLAYTIRKAKEYKADNIKFLHSDILSLSDYKKNFDIIFCAGVIHHMEHPNRGLEILCNILNNNGHMRLGLYSKIAREKFSRIKNYVKKYNFKSDVKGVREFKSYLANSQKKDFQGLSMIRDYFNTSECIDLFFNMNERTYDCLEIKKMLSDHHLDFCGFSLPEAKLIYKNHYPEDKTMLNLKNWYEFESNYPQTFTSMYQFWVKKKV